MGKLYRLFWFDTGLGQLLSKDFPPGEKALAEEEGERLANMGYRKVTLRLVNKNGLTTRKRWS